MDTLKLETTYRPHLKNQFSKGSVVLFLGAGFSLDARNISGDLVPPTTKLTQRLWKLCYPNEEFDQTTQLQDIFETAQALRKKELTAILQTSFSIDIASCPSWYHEFLTMPWLRIYTLNIDDLVTKILSDKSLPRPLKSISAMNSEPLPSESTLAVIHLNGTLDDIPDRVTFSRSQYAQRAILDEPAYAQLRSDLQLRSVIFVGSSMEEGLLWSHLELRGIRNPEKGRELRPRSYLVIPYLNRSKEALLSKYNIVHIEITASNFNGSVLSEMSLEKKSGNKVLRSLSHSTGADLERFVTVSDLVPKAVKGEEYLLGAEPTWDDVTCNRIAHRGCFDNLWENMSGIRSNPVGNKFILLTGTAGTGKTSALMMAAMRLGADGVTVAWLDKDNYISFSGFNKAITTTPELEALFINDADIYGSRFSHMVRTALEHNPKLLIVAETRSTKVDSVIRQHELQLIQTIEYSIPNLSDEDISGLLNVLDREHRLGQLKGKSRDERQAVFRKLAGRQLLVAMHIATHGKDFKEKVQDELNSLTQEKQFLYGLICVATAHRLALRKDDIGIAYGSTDTLWIAGLDDLIRRKLILPNSSNSFRARHRMIAQFSYDSLVVEGKLSDIVRGLILVGATKTSERGPRHLLYPRLLRTFINHNLLTRGVGILKAREIYAEFENVLAWNYHYWLHRGALELESDNLPLAENFLRQAKSIGGHDIYIDNELAYLKFKKANANPKNDESPKLVEEAIGELRDAAGRRSDLGGHTYHIMGSQGLLWVRMGIHTNEEKRLFLENILGAVKKGEQLHQSEMIKQLREDLQRELYSLAVVVDTNDTG